MKCPKCRYLSFEPELRCKHCGYDLSIAEPDLALRSTAAPAAAPAAVVSAPPLPLRMVATAERAEPSAGTPTPPDLPLFLTRTAPDAASSPADLPEDEPHILVPTAPRPLAVRRRAADPGRPGRAATDATLAASVSSADRDLLDHVRRVEAAAAPVSLPASRVTPDTTPVPASTRLAAASVDALLLFGVNAAVFLLTLRQCGLSLDQMASVPVVPLAVFLASLTIAYLMLFTVVSGQTVGKMIFGLRVVDDSDDAGAHATAKQMSTRELLALASMLLLGIGFLPLLGGQGRTLHDRLTHTRVVRA
jgi:uncharacterized RDD family membrane protein YckC